MNKETYIDILLSMKEGTSIRVPVKDSKEFNAQRMACWRGLQALQKKGFLLSEFISLRKVEEGTTTFLEINYRSEKKRTIFIREEDGSFRETTVDSLTSEE